MALLSNVDSLVLISILPFSPKENTPAARMPKLQKSIIKQRAQKLRQLGEELLDEVKKECYLPRKVLIEEGKTGAVVGYDQNYIKHRIPMIGLPIGEIVTA